MTTMQGPSIPLDQAVDFLDQIEPASTDLGRFARQCHTDAKLVGFLRRFDTDRKQTRRLIKKYLPRAEHVQRHQHPVDRSYRLINELSNLVSDFDVHSRLLAKKIQLGITYDLDKHLKQLRRKFTAEEAETVLQRLIRDVYGEEDKLDKARDFAAANRISEKTVDELARKQRGDTERAELRYDGYNGPFELQPSAQ